MLLVCGWTLLTIAWLVGNPPFASPDEGDNYVRAAGISDGHLLGSPAPSVQIGVTPAQRAWTRQATRAVLMPAGLAMPPGCFELDPHISARCLTREVAPPGRVVQVTSVGTYQPLPYLVPAAVLRIADSPFAALRWARLPGALMALVLMGLGVALVRDPSEDVRALLGPLTAITPMVLFCGATFTGSGLEISAGFAYACGLLRISRGPPPAWAWVAFGIAGAVLCLSRSASPLWAVVVACLPVALSGRRVVAARLRGGGRPAMAACGLIALAAITNRVWETAYGPHLLLGTHALALGVRNGLEQWARAAPELVGGFDYLEFRLPVWLPLLWLAILLTLGGFAWRVATERQRRTMAGAAVVAVFLPVVFYVGFYRRTGFGLQGRHMLPFEVALPLVVGELVYRRSARLPAALIPILAAAAGSVQFVAFWLNARRSAVGADGPLLFLDKAQWRPPLGWVVVLALALVGAAAISCSMWSHASGGRQTGAA